MKAVTVGLLASLAFNIALVGFMGGRLVGGAPPQFRGPHDRPHHDGPGFGGVLGHASPETRMLFHKAFETRWGEIRRKMSAQGELRKALATAILAEPFDRAKVEAAFKALRDAAGDIQASQTSVVVDVLAQLPPAERRAIAEGLKNEDRPFRFRLQRGPGGFDGPPPGQFGGPPEGPPDGPPQP